MVPDDLQRFHGVLPGLVVPHALHREHARLVEDFGCRRSAEGHAMAEDVVVTE